MAKGLDVGSMFVKSAERSDKICLSSMRNCFVGVEHSDLVEQLLSRWEVLHIRTDGMVYVVGDYAIDFADIFDKQIRRPMSQGTVSAEEPSAIPILKLIIEQILGKPNQPDEKVLFSVPPEAVDANISPLYYRKTIQQIVEEMGYDAEPINEGVAAIYSELADDNLTGISICFGAGTTTASLVRSGNIATSFSIARGGDWIDTKVAEATENPVNNAISVKERSSLITSDSEKNKNIDETIEVYYREFISYICETMEREFNRLDINQETEVPIIIIGGSSKVDGFAEVFEDNFKMTNISIPVGEIHYSDRPQYTPVQGALSATVSPENESVELSTTPNVSSQSPELSTEGSQEVGSPQYTTTEIDTENGSAVITTDDPETATRHPHQYSNTTQVHTEETDVMSSESIKQPSHSVAKSPGQQSLSPEKFDHQTVIGRTPTTVVHKVTVDSVNEPIAIKLPGTHGTLNNARNIFESFHNESKRWAQLADHRHVVGVIDWGADPIPWLRRDPELPWLAMEYMNGGELGEHSGELSVEETLWVAERLADAIWYAHHQGGGFIHQDLKPKNILFRKTPGEQYNVPKIADWELAQTVSNHSDTGSVATPQYIAPEQAHNDPVDQLTDQFQLGIVLYELFTGNYPFLKNPESASEETLITGILQEEPTLASELRADLPEALDDILHRMLEKDPSERHEAMLQVRDALGELRQSISSSANRNSVESETDTLRFNSGRNDRSRTSVDSPHETGTEPEEIGYTERITLTGQNTSRKVVAKADTGATRTCIDADLAAQIGIPATGETKKRLGQSTTGELCG